MKKTFLGVPQAEERRLSLGGKCEFLIEAKNLSKKNVYVKQERMK